MQGSHYADAMVLLFDRNRPLRKQTRSILNVLGFKTFTEFGELEEVRHALRTQRTDIAVMALESTDCGVLDLIDDVRHQRCALDPFIPILLTTWDAKLRSVRPVLEPGADDILLNPYSTTQMGQRIETLIHHRKPFVVTEDYFGPDRRSTAARDADPTSIVVPNALQATIVGQRAGAPTASRINGTLGELRRLKLRNMSRRIWFLADKLNKAVSDPELPRRYSRELTTLRTSIGIYTKTLVPTDPSGLSTLCDSLAGLLAGLFGKPADAKDLFLLEQSAMALRVASKLDHEESETGDAISDAVSQTNRVKGELIRAVLG